MSTLSGAFFVVTSVLLVLFKNVHSSVFSDISKPIDINLQDVGPKEVYSKFYNLSDTTTYLNVFGINESISFIVLQVHAYAENVTLEYGIDPNSAQFHRVEGMSVGLVWQRTYRNISEKQFILTRPHITEEHLQILVAISTYSFEEPIPGGCNLSFETEIAPYQKVFYSTSTIEVISQPAARYEKICDSDSKVFSDMYFMYLNEYDNSPSAYFDAIEKMLSIENITKYGTKVSGSNNFKQLYNLYRGTGIVFASIASYGGERSAYVPIISFGCSFVNWNEDCYQQLRGVHWKLYCAILLILGPFICIAGHRFLKTATFLIGHTFGFILTFLCVSKDDDFSEEGKFWFALSMGLLFGAICIIWYKKRTNPLESALCTYFVVGLLITSIILFAIGNEGPLKNDVVFWCFFITIVASIAYILTVIFLYTTHGHFFSLSLLGSFALTIVLNFYIGGYLPYIVINIYRRASIHNYGQAVVQPPFQFLDLSQILLWIFVLGLGWYIQYRHSIDKPAFPPFRNSSEDNERNPLLIPSCPEAPPAYMSIYPRINP